MFIFTKTGIIAIIAVVIFLFFFRDYPAWRAKKLQQQINKEQIQTNQQHNHENEQEESEQQNKEHNQTQEVIKENLPIENVSLVHYIFVAPFAFFYIIIRAIMDAIRFTIYYTLWSIERSIPYIDDFLFETVTVRIPKAINYTEKWWIEKGKPVSIRIKNNIHQHALPSIINATEVTFVSLYQAFNYFYKCTVDLIQVWKRFIDRHDWERLANDLCEVWYKMFWKPTKFVVTKTISLCQIIYKGCYSAYHSIRQDIIWLVDVAIPTVYDYVITSRLAKIIHSGLTIIGKYGAWAAVCTRDYLLAPTLGRLLTWIVRGIDQMILILQQNRFQERCQQLYRFIAPGIMCMVLELCQLVQSVLTVIQMTFNLMIIPSYRLFTKHVIPRLKIAYQRLSNKLYELYISYIYPIWIKTYPLIQIPLIWLYKNLSGPIYTFSQLCYKQVELGIDAGVWILYKVTALSKQFMHWFTVYTGQLYHYVLQWLEKQAPILSKLIQDMWEKVYNQDWEAFRSEIWSIAISTYEWTKKQSTLVYESLERSLTTWASEQGASFENEDVHKKRD